MYKSRFSGAGLGLRRGFMEEFLRQKPAVDFLEVAPENWIGMGGAWGRQFRRVAADYPLVLHGLSLNLGGFAPLDWELIRRVKQFMATHSAVLYSEHLSACGDQGLLYDLMPIPFTEATARATARRIGETQDCLGERIAIENVSYYAAPGAEMSEAEFIRLVLEEADCLLLLDINNIYVNARNHGYEAADFLARMPAERVAYLHVAGHYQEPDGLIVDTHGAAVIDPVWRLLGQAYARLGAIPTLLERDFNLPPLPELLREAEQILAIQQSYAAKEICHEPGLLFAA
jgi:uncharacterized protein (UPF0276 family)